MHHGSPMRFVKTMDICSPELDASGLMAWVICQSQKCKQISAKVTMGDICFLIYTCSILIGNEHNHRLDVFPLRSIVY